MCSESYNLIDTFLQLCFQGIKIILTFFDSIFIFMLRRSIICGRRVGGVTVSFGKSEGERLVRRGASSSWNGAALG